MLISTPIIIAAEIICLLLAVSLSYAFIVWRRNNRLIAAIDKLTSEMAENEAERLESIRDNLEFFCKTDSDHAEQISGEFARIEKLFIQDLVALLLGNQQQEIASLTSRIYSLTDDLIDTLKTSNSGGPDKPIDDTSEPNVGEDVVQSADSQKHPEQTPENTATPEAAIETIGDASGPPSTENPGAEEDAISEDGDIEVAVEQLDDSESANGETTIQETASVESENRSQSMGSQPQINDVSNNAGEPIDASETLNAADTGSDEDVLSDDGDIEIRVAQPDDLKSDTPKSDSAVDVDAKNEDNPTANDQPAATQTSEEPALTA